MTWKRPAPTVSCGFQVDSMASGVSLCSLHVAYAVAAIYPDVSGRVTAICLWVTVMIYNNYW